MLKRLFGSRAKAIDPRPVVPSGKDGGHGDHWGCILRAVQEKELIPYLANITKKDNQPYTYEFGPGFSHKGLAFYSEPGPIRTCVLVTNNTLATAYPEVQDGPVWPISITEVVPWANGIEGQITGTCHEAVISFFDTRFYANQRKYDVGKTYNFHMGALGYTIGLAEDREVDTTMGAKVSMKGASAYMPATIDNEQADIDDIWFHSPLEGDKEMAYLLGPPIQGFPIIMAIPDDFEMRLTVYGASHVQAPELSRVQSGDDLQGFLWLQGYLAT